MSSTYDEYKTNRRSLFELKDALQQNNFSLDAWISAVDHNLGKDIGSNESIAREILLLIKQLEKNIRQESSPALKKALLTQALSEANLYLLMRVVDPYSIAPMQEERIFLACAGVGASQEDPGRWPVWLKLIVCATVIGVVALLAFGMTSWIVALYTTHLFSLSSFAALQAAITLGWSVLTSGFGAIIISSTLALVVNPFIIEPYFFSEKPHQIASKKIAAMIETEIHPPENEAKEESKQEDAARETTIGIVYPERINPSILKAFSDKISSIKERHHALRVTICINALITKLNEGQQLKDHDWDQPIYAIEGALASMPSPNGFKTFREGIKTILKSGFPYIPGAISTLITACIFFTALFLSGGTFSYYTIGMFFISSFVPKLLRPASANTTDSLWRAYDTSPLQPETDALIKELKNYNTTLPVSAPRDVVANSYPAASSSQASASPAAAASSPPTSTFGQPSQLGVFAAKNNGVLTTPTDTPAASPTQHEHTILSKKKSR